MSDLDKLIEAVEGGAFLMDVIPHEVIAYRAFNGSLDAAKALHEALLPGWVFDVTNGSAFVCSDIKYETGQFCGESDAEARAWLIAILKAYRAQQEA